MTDANLSKAHFPSSKDDRVLELSVGDLLRQAVAEVPERVAVKAAGASSDQWTYAELLRHAEHTARALLTHFDPGDRIAVWALNKPEWVLLQLGAALAGLTLVTVNPANRTEEVRYLLKQSRSRGLFMDRAFRDLDNEELIQGLRSELPDLEKVFFFDQWSAFFTDGADPRSLPTVDPDDAVLVVYTSGTTGKPKGVVLRHRGVVNNGRFGSTRYEIDKGAVWLNPLPMFTIGGSVTMTLGIIANRGTQVIMPGFDPGLMLQSINDDGVNLTMAVPTMLQALFAHESFATTDLSSLELIITGGTTIPPEIIAETKAKMGVDMEVIFGQTEAGGVMAQTRRSDTDERISNTVGLPFPSYSMKIIDTETGETQPVNEIGEICVRSPCMMKEYFDMPQQTAEAIDAEGWMHTGDLGIMRPDGYVQITGRLKDMIISGGQNIYPREIEDRLVEHEDVAEVALFGAPDPKWGEKVVAAVRVQSGRRLDGAALADYLDGKIARYKIPKEWIAVDAMPINAMGKVMKFVLRDQYLADNA